MDTAVLILLCSFILLSVITLIVITSSRQEICINDTSIPLDKVLPIQCIDKKFIINGDGDITAGYKLFFPEVFSLSPEDAEKLFEDFNGILKMLSPGTIIHEQRFFFTGKYQNENISDIQNYIEKENLKYYEGKPVLKNYTHLYLTFTDKNSISKNGYSSSLLRKTGYPFKQPYKDYGKRLPDIESQLINFENGIKGIPAFSMLRMNDEELNNSLYDYLNCSYDSPTQDAVSQVVSPIAISDQGDFKIGNQFIAILSLVEEGAVLYPNNKIPKTSPSSSFGNGILVPENIKSKASMIYPLGLGLPIDHILNVTIEITDPDIVLTQLKGKSKGLNFLSIFYEPAAQKQKQITKFCDEISEKGYSTAYTSVNVILKDTDRYQLQRNISLTTNAFMNMNHSRCFVENLETANLFFTSIPGNARSNYRGFISTTEHGLCYLDKEGLYLSDKKGLTFLDRFHNPVIIDIWDSPYIKNRNIILIGPSGSGKSYLINYLLFQFIVKGTDVISIDIGGSNKNTILLNRGKYFNSKDPRQFSFNPFLCPKDKDGNYVYINNDPDDEEASEDKITLIATIICEIWKGKEELKKIEWSLLKESIIKFYEFVNKNNKVIFPSLTEYQNFIASADYIQDDFEKSRFNVKEISSLLKDYTTGQYGYLLNAENNIDIVSDTLIGYDMETASKAEYFPIVSIMTLSLIAEKIKKRKGIPKILVIDEGFDFLMDNKMSPFIAYLYRTFRKKEGSICLAAQNVRFLNEVPDTIRDSILTNSDIKILLDHRNYSSSYPDLKETLSITDNEISMLDSIQDGEGWRQFFIKLGNRSFIFTTDVSEIADAALDSREKVVQKIQKLFLKTRSLPSALNQYIESKKTATN